MQVNIVLVPDMVQLDAIGPFEVMARTPGWNIDFVAASLETVRTERGLTILPTRTRETALRSDLLVVPGGSGIDRAMLDGIGLPTRGEKPSKQNSFLGSAQDRCCSRHRACSRGARPADIGFRARCSPNLTSHLLTSA